MTTEVGVDITFQIIISIVETEESVNHPFAGAPPDSITFRYKNLEDWASRRNALQANWMCNWK